MKWRALRQGHPNKTKTVCFPRPPHLKRHPFRSLCRRYIRDRSLKTQIAPSPRQRITTTFIKGSVARSLNLLPAIPSLHTRDGLRVHCSLFAAICYCFQRTCLVALDCIFLKNENFPPTAQHRLVISHLRPSSFFRLSSLFGNLL